MAKPKLLNNTDTATFPDITWPTIETHYRETQRNWTWRPEYEGTLEMKLYYAGAGSEKVFEKRFSTKLDVTQQKTGKRSYDCDWNRPNLETTILSFILDKSKQLRLVTRDALSDEQFEQVESRMVDSVAIVTEMPQLSEIYRQGQAARIAARRQTAAQAEQQNINDEAARVEQKRKAEEKRQRDEQEARQKEIERRRTEVLDKVRIPLRKFESDAMYAICTRVSRKSDYELPRQNVEERVKHLFDTDDNLAHRPLFKTSNGAWADFVRTKLGEGFYNKLKNVENDLDEFYLTVLEEVQRQTGEKGEVTEEVYHQAICNKFTLDEVTNLLERERDVYTELLKRFNTILGKGPIDYRRALESLKDRIRFTGEFITATSPDVPEFSPKDETENDKAAFEEAKRSIQDKFQKYLKSNAKYLVVPAGDVESYDRSEVLVIRTSDDQKDAHALAGSCGTLQYCGYSSEDKQVSFSYITGKPTKLPFSCSVSRKTLKKAQKLEQKYGNIGDAAQAIIQEAAERSTSSVEDKDLTATQKKIKEFHPYLEEQMEFRQGFFQGMKSRFEEIYAKHAKKPQERTAPPTPAQAAS
jgi:hypothetical protein